MDAREALKILVFIILCELIGAIGTIATSPNIPTWYASLSKPAFNPPNWVFGPVWTILYALMGISAYLIYKSRNKGKNAALIVFAAQLFLNVLWSFAFFGAKSPLYGLVVIVLLWAAIVFTILKFRAISKTAAYLLIPYLLWASFAAVLNYSVWTLN